MLSIIRGYQITRTSAIIMMEEVEDEGSMVVSATSDGNDNHQDLEYIDSTLPSSKKRDERIIVSSAASDGK